MRHATAFSDLPSRCYPRSMCMIFVNTTKNEQRHDRRGTERSGE